MTLNKKHMFTFLLLLLTTTAHAWTYTTQFNSLSEGGWSVFNDYSGSPTITGSEYPSVDPSNSLQFYEPIGFPDSGRPGVMERYFPSGTQEFYMQYYFKYGSNFRFHSSGNKQVYIYANDGGKVSTGDGGVIDSWIWDDPHMHPMVVGYWRESNTGNNPTINRDQWYKVVFRMKYVSAGKDIFQLWIDDVLVCDYNNLTMASNYSTAAFNYVAFAPVWGGKGETPLTKAQYQWYDYAILSSDPIPAGTNKVGTDPLKVPTTPIKLQVN